MDFKETAPLYKLQEIAEKLRSPGGCPWDIKQTHETLKNYLIEEAYEVIDAIETGKDEDIIEELGDLLYQVYAHSQIAKEKNRFNIDIVAEGIISKLIRRHPHVFSDENITSAEDVSIRWENIKKEEKKQSAKSLLDGVPKHLPALQKALRIQEKTSRIGFDWETIEGPIDKIEEELNEIKEAFNNRDTTNLEEEFGDLLFTLVNTARFLNIEPEKALQKSNNKFIDRFKKVESEVNIKNLDMNTMTIDELDKLWEKAKKKDHT